jgi:hypothetical protein
MDSRKDATKCWLYYLSYGPSIASISSSLNICEFIILIWKIQNLINKGEMGYNCVFYP